MHDLLSYYAYEKKACMRSLRDVHTTPSGDFKALNYLLFSFLSCVDVIQPFTYLLRVIILDVTKRRREKARGNMSYLSYIPLEKKSQKLERVLKQDANASVWI